MENTAKLLGGARQEFFRGAGAKTPPAGYAFYAISIRVDATEITTLNEKQTKATTARTVTNYTWQNTAYLLAGDYIQFEFPVTSITLKNATDSIWAFCIPYAG